uniref:Uncharacterized protein n=1 Tax=Panagrolaimus superbus TaxID=310955 RepID=A0A914YJH0_9BILA
MKTQLTNSAKIQTNKTEKLKQKLLNSMAKVDKIQLQLKRRLKKICEERSEMKHKLDQMKAIVDGFEGELQETEVEMSSLKTDLTFSNIPDESSENSELMERFYNAQKAFEDRKASCLQKKAIKEQQMSELKAVEMKIRELQKRKTDTVKVIPQRNQSDFTLNQSAWDF